MRPGAGKAVVEGAFEGIDARTRRRIEELGLDVEDGRVVVRREVSAEGRSRAWVNGSPTTAAVLAQLGALLVDLHGQHETQSLLHADAQRDILDAFAHAGAGAAAVAEAHATLARASCARRRRSRAGATRCAAGPTTCGTSCSEIDAARLKPGEDEALAARGPAPEPGGHAGASRRSGSWTRSRATRATRSARWASPTAR